jgi:hypothetical protein
MTTRILPSAEWARLAGTELEGLADHIAPGAATVLVVEDGGGLLACWSLVTILHAEGLWIHPAHRGRGGVARRLLAGMRKLVTERGASGVVTASMHPVVTQLLEHAGAVPVPGTAYTLPMGKKDLCHSSH